MKFKIKNPNPLRFDKSRYLPAEHLTIQSLPSGKLDAFETPELMPRPVRPLNLLCDCCLSPTDRLWIHCHYGFCIKMGRRRVDFNEGAWSFCVQCWALFTKSEIALLTARVAVLNPDLDPVELGNVYEILRQVVYGEVRTWESGQTVDWAQ